MDTNDNRLDDFDRGAANRRAVLGDAWVDQSLQGATAFTAEFQALITRYAWHDIWGRPGLDRTTRRLLVLGMTMGLARWEEFELHCRAAIRGGVPIEAIKEVLMQGAIYCGVPAANTAFKKTADILRDEGLQPAPAPLTSAKRVALHHTFSRPQLAVAVQGPPAAAKVPVLLSHALGLDLHMWDALAERLADAGHPVLRYDHRGHGKSAVPPGPYSLDELVGDAARVLREWGVGPAVWIGLSMGGMVGQGVAIRHPDLVAGLVLANTTSGYPAAAAAMFEERMQVVQREGMSGIADAVLERFFSADFRQSRPAELQTYRRTLLACNAAGYAASCHAVAQVAWTDQLAAIRVPTLVIAGALDMSAPPAMSEVLAREITGAERVVFEGVAHISAVESPRLFEQAVEGFLRRYD